MTSVLIATNEPVLAHGFATILAGGGMEVLDVCTDLGQLFDCLRSRRPDMAILDMAMSPVVEAMVELRKLAPRCQLLIWPRQISEKQAQDLVKAGARGVLPSDVTPELLLATLNMIGSFPEPEPTPATLVKHVCNRMERQIISLVGCGMKNNEIAAVVQCDTRTVDHWVKTLSRRLGVQDRHELALYGLSIAGETLQYTER